MQHRPVRHQGDLRAAAGRDLTDDACACPSTRPRSRTPRGRRRRPPLPAGGGGALPLLRRRQRHRRHRTRPRPHRTDADHGRRRHDTGTRHRRDTDRRHRRPRHLRPDHRRRDDPLRGAAQRRHPQEEAGRARLRKYVVTENVTETVPVSREEVRVEREPITDANVGERRSTARPSPRRSTRSSCTPSARSWRRRPCPVERVRLDTRDRHRPGDGQRRGPQGADRGRRRRQRPPLSYAAVSGPGDPVRPRPRSRPPPGRPVLRLRPGTVRPQQKVSV